MEKLNFENFCKTLDQTETRASLNALKTMYERVDAALSEIAVRVDVSKETASLETQLLHDQADLVRLASKTRCKDIHEISQKVDFLNTVHLKEKRVEEFNRIDILTKSIWEDCRAYL